MRHEAVPRDRFPLRVRAKHSSIELAGEGDHVPRESHSSGSGPVSQTLYRREPIVKQLEQRAH
jgi:hypothetical protein